MTVEATYVRDIPTKGSSRQKLYRLSEPYALRDYEDNPTGATEYIVISAVFDLVEVFAADETGEVTDWEELPGSRKGDGWTHDLVLEMFLTAANRQAAG